MQTVLVAGGAGFIGSHLCQNLLSSFKVICIDNLITGNEDNIVELKKNPHFNFIHQDVSDPITNPEIIGAGIDYIFHLASPASPNAKSKKSYITYPVETLKSNSFGTYNLLEIAKEQKAKFLFTSTSEVYGDPEISPQPESYWGNVNPVGIRSVYDEGKRFGEALVMAYVRKYAVDARIARIFNTYGPKMDIDDGRVVSNFITQALRNKQITMYGNGKQTRSFCYISDMVDALSKLLFTPDTQGMVVNLGNPLEITVEELARRIIIMTNSASSISSEPLPEDDPKKRCPDISRAKKILQWEPKVPLEIGLGSTIEYFKGVL